MVNLRNLNSSDCLVEEKGKHAFISLPLQGLAGVGSPCTPLVLCVASPGKGDLVFSVRLLDPELSFLFCLMSSKISKGEFKFTHVFLKVQVDNTQASLKLQLPEPQRTRIYCLQILRGVGRMWHADAHLSLVALASLSSDFRSCVSKPNMKLPRPSWASDCSNFSDKSNTWPVV